MKVLLETGFIIATAKIIYAVSVFLDKESGKNKKIKKSLIDILLSFVIELCEFILLKTLNVEAQDVILKTVIICSVLQIILIYVLAFIKKRKKSPRFNIMNLFIVIFISVINVAIGSICVKKENRLFIVVVIMDFLFDKYSEVIDKMLYQKWEFSIKDGIGNYGIVTTNKDSIFFHGEDSSFFFIQHNYLYNYASTKIILP